MATGTELELIKLIKSVIGQGDLNVPLIATDASGNVTGLVGPDGALFNTNPVGRYVGYELEQPGEITRPVSRYGKLAAVFGGSIWTATVGSPTLTQNYTGWDGSGNKTGITSRTGQPTMLKVVPAANTTERITLGSVATNMLTRGLSGKFGLWVYLESQPGYQVGGTLTGGLSVEISTSASMTNGLLISFNTNQLREGWNFLKFIMRNPSAYVSGSGVTEYHPFGVASAGYGTGADTNIVGSDVTTLRIEWVNMLGATLYFDSIWTDFSCQPQVVLGCDGGINVKEIALPIFQTYGWKGYAAFPYQVWASGSKTIVDLNSNTSTNGRDLYSSGWDFINHTANHLSNGTLTSEAEIVYEIATARAWQYALDMPRGAEFYASPQSSSSRLSEAVIKGMGLKLQRHARKWNTSITPFGIDNPHHVGAIDMGSVSSSGVSQCSGGVPGSVAGWQIYSKLSRMLDVLEAYGDTIFPFWHGVTTSGDTGSGEDLTGDNLLLTESAFEKFCADLRARELAGRITVCDGLSGFWYGRNL